MIRAERVHLSGIGGIAMASLAAMLARTGRQVTGSDTGVYPPASDLLRGAGISWKEGYKEENLQPRPDWVVIGNALSRGNPEVEYILDQKIPYRSLPGVVEEIFLPGRDSLVVSGTHGKTTTTSLLAWILHVAGRRPNFLIGGMVQDFGSSFGLEGGEEFVIEGDEYDSAFFDKGPKFLHYHPRDLIITSVEYDHADIYPDLPAIEVQFRRLVNLVPRGGRIVAWGGSESVRGTVANVFCSVEMYGLETEADWCADGLNFRNGGTCFRVSHRGTEFGKFEVRLAGRHNVLNALAAIALAGGRGVTPDAIRDALASFRGVRRRLEEKGEAGGVIVVDDFAHHPTAIRETISAARLRWPGRRIWVAFEPRSNTMRRRIFERALADEERLEPERVVGRIRAAGREAWALVSAAEIAERIAGRAQAGDVALVLSNGSFDGLCEKLISTLSQRASH